MIRALHGAEHDAAIHSAVISCGACGRMTNAFADDIRCKTSRQKELNSALVISCPCCGADHVFYIEEAEDPIEHAIEQIEKGRLA